MNNSILKSWKVNIAQRMRYNNTKKTRNESIIALFDLLIKSGQTEKDILTMQQEIVEYIRPRNLALNYFRSSTMRSRRLMDKEFQDIFKEYFHLNKVG